MSIGNRSTPSLLKSHHMLHHQAKLFYPSERPPLKIPVRGNYYAKLHGTAGQGYVAHFVHFNALQIPPDVARRLYDNYKENILPRYPCFTNADLEEQFRRTYYENPGNTTGSDIASFIVTMVLAISSLTSKRHDFRKVAALSESLHLDALRHAGFLKDATIRSLQGLLLLIQLALLLPDTGNLWYMTGEAMRMAISFGLHRELDISPKDVVQTELFRCLFWVTYQLDRTVAIAAGCPIALSDEHITTRLPFHGGDSHVGLDEILVGGSCIIKEKQFLVHTRVCILQSEIHGVQFFDHPLPENLPDYSSWVQRTKESIDLVQKFSDDYNGPSWLNSAAHQCQILLHRPCSRNIAPPASSLVAAVRASIQLVNTSLNLTTAGGVVLAFELANSAFHAGMVLLFALRNHALEVQQASLSSDSYKALEVLAQIFDMLAQRWPAVHDTSHYLKELIETNLRSPVGNPGSDYDANVLAELDFLVTQRRIHSIYHRNISLPSQSEANPGGDLSALASEFDVFEDEAWWRDFINDDFALDTMASSPGVVASGAVSESQRPVLQNVPQTRPNSTLKEWRIYLDGILEALPACSSCRDRRIKCNRQIPCCKECDRTSRECVYFDPILLENVPLVHIYNLAEKVKALTERTASFAPMLLPPQPTHIPSLAPMKALLVPLKALEDEQTARLHDGRAVGSSVTFFGPWSSLETLNSVLHLNLGWDILGSLGDNSVQGERISMESMVPNINRPPVSVAMGLFHLFSRSANTFFPVMDVSSVEDVLSYCYGNDIDTAFRHRHEIFYLILAIASQIAKRDDSVLGACANAYFKKAVSQLSTTCEHSSRSENIFLLQRTLLITVYLLLSPGSGDIWRTLGFAIRLFLDLSHRPSMDEDEDHYLFCLLTRTLYCLESQVSIAFGRPTLLIIGDKLRDELIAQTVGNFEERISIFHYLISFRKMQIHSILLRQTLDGANKINREFDCRQYRSDLDDWVVSWRRALEEVQSHPKVSELTAWGELHYHHGVFMLSKVWPTPGGHPINVCENISKSSAELIRHQILSAFLSSAVDDTKLSFVYPINWTVSHIVFQAGLNLFGGDISDRTAEHNEAAAFWKCLSVLSYLEADPNNLSTGFGSILAEFHKFASRS
ncbi:Fc.00g054980.m01.CDS01 [Cosmosporella sp. VM-42]